MGTCSYEGLQIHPPNYQLESRYFGTYRRITADMCLFNNQIAPSFV